MSEFSQSFHFSSLSECHEQAANVPDVSNNSLFDSRHKRSEE